MDYTVYHFTIAPNFREIVFAFLAEMAFEMFEEGEHSISAFLPEDRDTPELNEQVEALQQRFDFSFEKKHLPGENWNAVWESNFKPIQVDAFCGIRADFHPPFTGVKYEITINPRMAFGTGHHATTYLMIAMMQEERFRNMKVLDYGCGTGILAILASKQGALIVDAVDIEKEAYENALENIQINNIDNIQVYHGKLDVILDHSFDIILANINRNVILNSLSSLYQKLKRGGVLLVSGILEQDRDLVIEKAIKLGFTLDHKERREDWVALRFLR